MIQEFWDLYRGSFLFELMVLSVVFSSIWAQEMCRRAESMYVKIRRLQPLVLIYRESPTDFRIHEKRSISLLDNEQRRW
jgi:hypothetical protein